MTALIIIACVLLPVLLILFSNVAFYLTVDSGLTMFVRFWLIKIKLPLKKKKSSEKQQKEKSKGELLKESKKDKNIIAKMIKEKGLRATIGELWQTFKPIILKAISLFKNIKVKKFNLQVITASDDAAKTALEYGGVCALVFPILSFLKSAMHFPNKITKVHIDADYDAEAPTLFLDLKLKVRVIAVVNAAISVVFSLIKTRFLKELNKQKI